VVDGAGGVKVKRNFGEISFDVANSLFLFLVVFVTVYPLLHVAFASLSEPYSVASHKGLLLYPIRFTAVAYGMVFDNPMIAISYRNTLIYVLAGTTVNIVLTTLGAYALSRRDLFWKNPIMFFIVFTMLFSGGLIPFYLTVTRLGMINSRLALVFPNAITTMNLIIMRTSYLSIPASMEESATIDGANDFIILTKIMLPLSMPIIAVMLLFYSVGHWNAWFHAMVFLRERELYPLQLILREILISSDTSSMTTGVTAAGENEIYSETIKYATIMVATVPILVLYPFLQRYFVKGIMVGAIKE
jgi:putative aldouronate transport system permease protein